MKSYRKNGKIIIEIEEDVLCKNINLIPEIGNSVVITDKEYFLHYCNNYICSFGDTGDFNSKSKLTKLIDDLIIEALDNDAGIEYIEE